MNSNESENPNLGRIEPESCRLTGPLPNHRELFFESVEGNWVRGTFKGYKFAAKIFANPSEWGIDGGRISTLQILACKDGIWLEEPEEPKPGSQLRRYPMIFNYDRGGGEGTPLGRELAAEFTALFPTGLVSH